MKIRMFTLLLASYSAAATTVHAQRVASDTTAIRISSAIRRGGSSASTLAIFRQQGVKRSAPELRALADSVVSIVLSPTASPVLRRNKEHLLVDLTLSAAATSAGELAGTPSSDAARALYKIAQSTETSTSIRATFGLTSLADSRQAVGYLSVIAQLDGPRAAVAVKELAYNKALSLNGGVDSLKVLWEGPRVKD